MSAKAAGAAFEAVVATLLVRELPDAVVHHADPRAARFGDDLFDCFDLACLSGAGTVWAQAKAYDATPSGVWLATVEGLPLPPATSYRFYALRRARPTLVRAWAYEAGERGRGWRTWEIEG